VSGNRSERNRMLQHLYMLLPLRVSFEVVFLDRVGVVLGNLFCCCVTLRGIESPVFGFDENLVTDCRERQKLVEWELCLATFFVAV